ncbi:hypothetical protein [Alteromonas sp. CYL-A6]
MLSPLALLILAFGPVLSFVASALIVSTLRVVLQRRFPTLLP